MRINRNEIWDKTYRNFSLPMGNAIFAGYTAVSYTSDPDNVRLASDITFEVGDYDTSGKVTIRGMQPVTLRRLADVLVTMADHIETTGQAQLEEAENLILDVAEARA